MHARWRMRTILAALALVTLAGCHSRTDVQCTTKPVLIDGKPTGLEQCSDGVIHRAEKVTCESHVPRTDVCPGDHSFCTTDADCTAHPFGHCDGFGGSCSCIYGCAIDDDCVALGFPEPTMCLCTGLVGQCALGQCTSDADCKGSFCTIVRHPTAVVDAPDVACLSPSNECEIDADCSAKNFCIAKLSVQGTGRECTGHGSFGNPF